MYWSVAGIACLLVVLGGLLGSASLAAEPVYRWLDADGVTHFSQRPPPPGAVGVTVQEAPTYQAAPDPDADYWSVTTGDVVHKDLVWGYHAPFAESAKIAGLVSFYNEKVDIYVDGKLEPRPKTKFS